ncbi:MAG: hypothetical protein JNL92_19355, partial [Opitutaceae bacterium]|nr:hypothetical protein [Opitutaceae bacterium]
MRRILVVATLLLAGGVVFYFWPSARRPGDPGGAGKGAENRPPPSRAAVPPGEVSAPSGARPPAAGPSAAAAPLPTPAQIAADFPIAAPLNAPDSTIARDLDIVRQLFEAWLSNFPREGNPIGENAEITAALMGENRLGLALIPRGHRALNDRGELCDRWGTPLRFHQLSGTQMEVRSAGPDRKFGTDDDAT